MKRKKYHRLCICRTHPLGLKTLGIFKLRAWQKSCIEYAEYVENEQRPSCLRDYTAAEVVVPILKK